MDKQNTTDKIVTVPNALTLVRFILVGVMALVFLSEKPVDALIVYLSAAATDLLDGYIARRFNQISNVGKVMDPIADKLMTVTALICMFSQKYLTTGVLIVIIVKEALMIIGGILVYFVFKKVVVANLFGKISAAAYFFAIVLLFLHKYVHGADAIVMYVAVTMNIISIFQYGYINIIMEVKKKRIEARN